jgi:hypothetical protein
MTDHCPACAVRRELTTHRDQCEPAWSPRRAAFNFAVIVAARACPDDEPTRPDHPTTEPEEADDE